LLENPTLRRELGEASGDSVRRFVEEVLRLHSPVEYILRRARREVRVGGVTIREGQYAIALTGAVNRDADRYTCPGEVNLDRRSPRDHFGFYKGPRTCPGQSLARFELERILQVALERLPDDLRRDPERPPPRYTGGMARRWSPLHVLFAPSR
jgi:cytochrome P450